MTFEEWWDKPDKVYPFSYDPEYSIALSAWNAALHEIARHCVEIADGADPDTWGAGNAAGFREAAAIAERLTENKVIKPLDGRTNVL